MSARVADDVPIERGAGEDIIGIAKSFVEKSEVSLHMKIFFPRGGSQQSLGLIDDTQLLISCVLSEESLIKILAVEEGDVGTTQ